MDIYLQINSNARIRAFYLFFIVVSTQIGVGVMSGPRPIFLDAQQDSWIAVLISYAAMVMVTCVMLFILKSYGNTDIFGVQVDIFGTWVGKILGTIYILHFAVSLLVVLVTYMDVVELFLFPQISTWVLGFLLLSLVTYCVAGGLRSIIGVVFIFFIFSHLLLLLLYKPVSLIDTTHYQPVLQASMIDLLKGAKSTTYMLTGFEVIFLLYPFIQNKKQVWRPMLLGITWSVVILLINTLIAIGYFSAHQLETEEWAVLSLFKIVNLPFIARFDVIVIAVWMMIILATMMLFMWGIIQGMKRLYHVPKRMTLYTASLIFFVLGGFIDDHHQIILLNNQANNIAFWIIFVYPFVLLPIVQFKKWKQRRSKKG